MIMSPMTLPGRTRTAGRHWKGDSEQADCHEQPVTREVTRVQWNPSYKSAKNPACISPKSLQRAPKYRWSKMPKIIRMV